MNEPGHLSESEIVNEMDSNNEKSNIFPGFENANSLMSIYNGIVIICPRPKILPSY